MNLENARIFEVGPRDGLQNESAILSVDQKIEFIERLVGAGVTDIEIGSFVHPKWVPQMADTDQVAARIAPADLAGENGVRYWALIPNRRGLERALAAGVKYISTAISSSEAHNQSNLNRSIADSLDDLRDSFKLAKDNGCQLRAYISTVFGCPYEGEVDFARVMDIAEQLLDFGADLIALGDTIGAGTPPQVEDGCRRMLEAFGPERVALHLHDTQGLGLTNALLAWRVGMRQFDSAVGGTGGCPYAPSAAGNLGSEDLIHLFNSCGIETGLDLEKLLQTTSWLEKNTPIESVSRYFQYRKSAEGSTL
ncbi:hydroxymethylglutaryl-CoA lyase [Bradymonas sediminis]|uniref:hydroxymethylglutaryl-CoA lyase n=1 Tax=Bradymonas sediminis TaxID=1548548 RepID=UPI0010CECBBB|nr:hydroxymethylglutaryl-CoA lyase [Bradymonas sediminis]TDP73880.1 hydroxymethylglutaryl-CoA lyase [Bradymonas sediminis]